MELLHLTNKNFEEKVLGLKLPCLLTFLPLGVDLAKC